MIYLDNAATTFPKPARVTSEVLRCLVQYCGNPGRGAHPLALRSAEKIYECRAALAAFLGLSSPCGIVFTCNTTYALNLALSGILEPESHVLLSELEHNAVKRPLCALRDTRRLSFDTFPVVGKTTKELLSGIEARIRPETRALVCTHASNICSITLPLDEIGAVCQRHGLYFIVDAAQSAGRLPIDMERMHISALAAPGHKSLFGIQGAGFLALADHVRLSPLVYGGAGFDSLSEHMPDQPPERYEAGTLPTPCIAGLHAGLEFVKELGMDTIEQQERALFLAAKERLTSLEGIRIYQGEIPGAVLLFDREGESPDKTAAALAARGICTRAGLHCAPLAHAAIGTPRGGAVRISFSPFNTVADLDALWHALKS